MNHYEPSYEDAILNAQESESDCCRDCAYKSTTCHNQCMQLHPIYNPNLK